jgi:diguanylate cyclase (GGDEF)-like protein/PAS domain S-box-containing protein
VVGAAGAGRAGHRRRAGLTLKRRRGAADDWSVPPPGRQLALFALARALFTTLDPDEVARRFDAHATAVIGGRARIWLLAGQERLDALGADAPESRAAAGDWRTALVERRPHASGTDFLVPLVCDGEATGIVQVCGAAPADLASGGMRFWRVLGEMVGEAVRNAQRHREASDSLRRFRALVEQMPAITYVDRVGTGDPIYVSPQLETISGVVVSQWMDGTDGWAKRVHPDDRDHAVSAYRDALAAGIPYRDEYRLVDADGRERWFHDQTAIVRDEHGAPAEMQGVILDITERKRTEQALHESEQRMAAAEARYRSLVEELPLGIYVNALDERSTPLYRSPATEAITGRSPAEWADDPGLLAEIVHPDDRERVLAGLAAAAAAGTRHSAEYRIVRPDGSVAWVLDESFQVRDRDGDEPCRQGYLLDVTAHRHAEERLAHVSFHDPLTGLPNRAMFQEHLSLAVARAEAAGDAVAVLLCDLDDFKLVNDSLGHGAGDALVLEVARRLGETVAEAGAVARLGGDEFAILLADLDPSAGGASAVADAMAERIRAALRAPAEISGTEIYCSASIGISLHPADADDPATLLKHADTALHRAKEGGRDGQHRYTRESEDGLEQLAMTGRLRRAIDEGRLVLHYQPLVELGTRGIVGVEALVRWQDGSRLIMPGDFIPLAERTGLIGAISEWVIAEACGQARAWRDAGLDLYVAVNLPPACWEPTAMRGVLHTIESFGLAPDRMMIEITESAFMNAPQRNEPVLAELHRRGLRLAIDDFGTGHSSLARLSQMAVTTLKIDRSFVSDVPRDHGAGVLVSTIIKLAEGLGLQPMAEGIETEEQLAFLIEHGCPLGQGYLFSRPVPAAEIERLVRGLADAA